MATGQSEPSETALAQAVDDLRALRLDLEALERRVRTLEGSGSELATPPPEAVAVPAADDESLWSWVGRSRVLPRVAMVSFALVLALVLRTLTEGGVIGHELGVVLGLGYCASLIALGWRLLRQQKRGQHVLPICGLLLLCSVVFEAHGEFALLSASTANWGLLCTLLVLAGIGLRYGSRSLVAFAVLTTGIAALAIDFPHPSYPHVALVVLAGNVIAFLALRIGRMEWLSWATFGLTLCLWSIWSVQVSAALRSAEGMPPELYAGWFLPLALLFAAVFAITAATRALRPSDSGQAFYAFLPAANVTWAYLAIHAAAAPEGETTTLSAVACGIAVAHLALAAWLARGARGASSGATAFAIAGAILFAWTSPSLIPGFALPLWSALALGLFACSTRCGSSGLRLASYALQILTCVALATSDLFAIPPAQLLAGTASALVIAALATWHFFLARNHPPQEGAWLSRIDRHDRLAITMLWVATISVYGLLRALSYQWIAASGSDIDSAFRCAQSVIINCSSILLMLWGLRARRGEILATAVLVAVIGGLKVVGSDLLTGHGVPLVLSVASFGAAATVGSLVLGRWLARRTPTTPD